MADFGVKLQAVNGARAVACGGHRASVGRGQGHEIALHRFYLIAVTHPHGCFARHTGEKSVGVGDAADGRAELAVIGRQHFAAEQVANQMHTIANAQHGDAEVEQAWIAVRCVRSINAGGTAGENQTARLQLGDALGRDVVADDLTEDVQLADAPSDELAVLRAEVENQNAFAFGRMGHRGHHYWKKDS